MLCFIDLQKLLDILTNVVTVWAVLYAFPTFILQRSIEDTDAFAVKTFELLPEIRMEVISLLNSKENQRDESIKRLYNLMTRLQVYLGFLSIDSADVENGLSVLLNHDNYTNDSKITFLEETFGPEWHDHIGNNQIEIPFLNLIRDGLMKIYNRRYYPWRQFFFILAITVAIYAVT